jgi:NADH-quinone oxidoreductase subunit A
MVFDILHCGILLCLMGGGLFAGGPLIAALLIAPNARGGDIGMPYECGMRPLGSPWTHFGINYYVYALLFIAFDVDVLYLYPAAMSYGAAEGWMPLVKLLIFLFFLMLALVYFKAKGVFSWPRKIPLEDMR